MRNLKNLGGIFVAFLCIILGVHVIKRLNILPGCNDWTEEQATVMHRPFQVLFPPDENLVKNKVLLTIGIICQPREEHIEKVKHSLTSILHQVSEKEKLFVLIGVDTDRIEFALQHLELIKTSFKDFQSKFNVSMDFLTVSKEYLGLRLNSPDVDSVLQFHHKSYVTRRIFQNLVFSLLFWYSSQYCSYFLLMDAEIILQDYSWRIITDNLEKFKTDKTVHDIDFGGESKFGSVFPSIHLPRLAEFCFLASPNAQIHNLFSQFQFFMQSLKTKHPSAKVILQGKRKLTPKLDNPDALVSTNMKVYDEIYFPTNPYERGELFWSETHSPNSTLTLQFLKPIQIRRIFILSGKDIYMQDDITRAVLEKSTSALGEECKAFETLTDFRNGFVDISLPKNEERISCLRIRLVLDEDHWVALRLIKVHPY